MLFKEGGNKALPTVILLHGGGLSSWSLSRVTELLTADYHVVTPIIDGHGENSGEGFVSIEHSTEKLLEYIDRQCGGRVFAVAGLSIGAQIAVEALSTRSDIAQFAILESPLVLPIKGVTALAAPTYKLCYGLIRQKWFSKIQAKTLFVPDSMLEKYYSDSVKMSRQSLINIAISNGSYTLKNDIEKTSAKVLIIAGEKERKIMKKSAALLQSRIPGSELFIARKMGHGELSLAHPEEYAKTMTRFLNKSLP